MEEWVAQTKQKAYKNSVKCGICKKWLVKGGINAHLIREHKEEYKLIKEKYYEVISEWEV